MDLSRYEAAFRRIIIELRPYLDDLVVIGGWVPYLYARYGGFRTWTAGTSLTAEVDVLVERPLPTDGRPPIPQILRAAGFHPGDGPGGLAVWQGNVGAGEKIEFLAAHRGTGRKRGTVVPVGAQEGMGAIALDGVDLLRRFRQRLAVPVVTADAARSLDVWVPTLGAYVVNKATTFSHRRRREDGSNPKQAKDLLYLRDLMAAGPEVVGRIAADLAAMSSAADRRMTLQRIAAARNDIALVLGGGFGAVLSEAAPMLCEREPSFRPVAAAADVEGHLADLLDVLSGHAR